jgi:hypothetical protein
LSFSLQGALISAAKEEKVMSKSNKKRGYLKRIGKLPPDDPIYTSGYIMLRPVHGPKPEPSDEPTVNAENSDSTDTDQESSGSGK